MSKGGRCGRSSLQACMKEINREDLRKWDGVHSKLEGAPLHWNLLRKDACGRWWMGMTGRSESQTSRNWWATGASHQL